MQLGLIPPKGLEGYALMSRFHLALAHVTHREYVRLYGVAAKRGDFIICDNGVAEGAKLDTKAICIAARRIGAHEVVLPDVIGSYVNTLVVTRKFLKELRVLKVVYDVTAGKNVQYMGVAHGTRVDGVKACIDEYADIPEITTVGIPRFLVDKVPNKSIRIDIANWIYHKYKSRFAIHLLGGSSRWPQEFKFAAKYAPHIRSADTSMPFNYALDQRVLTDKTTQQVDRPAGYFVDLHTDLGIKDLIKGNIATMLEWVATVSEPEEATDEEAPVS